MCYHESYIYIYVTENELYNLTFVLCHSDDHDMECRTFYFSAAKLCIMVAQGHMWPILLTKTKEAVHCSVKSYKVSKGFHTN